jgi:hypothetical protein
MMKVSERFACRVTGQNRTTQRREPTGTTPADPDAALRTWLRSTRKTIHGAGSGPRITSPRLGLGREPQEDPAALAGGRAAGAAASSPQTSGH